MAGIFYYILEENKSYHGVISIKTSRTKAIRIKILRVEHGVISRPAGIFYYILYDSKGSRCRFTGNSFLTRTKYSADEDDGEADRQRLLNSIKYKQPVRLTVACRIRS